MWYTCISLLSWNTLFPEKKWQLGPKTNNENTLCTQTYLKDKIIEWVVYYLKDNSDQFFKTRYMHIVKKKWNKTPSIPWEN